METIILEKKDHIGSFRRGQETHAEQKETIGWQPCANYKPTSRRPVPIDKR